MIFAVSGDPNEKRTKPRQVPRKLMGKAAWKNHKMREVPDPSIEPVPQRIAPIQTGPDERDALIAELQAKLAATETGKEPAAEATKRGPGRPPKETPQA